MGDSVPGGQKPPALTSQRDVGGSLPSLHPKSTIQLWLQRQKARLEEKVRGGVEGGGRKSLSEEGLVGQLPCHHPEGAWRGEDWGDQEGVMKRVPAS